MKTLMAFPAVNLVFAAVLGDVAVDRVMTLGTLLGCQLGNRLFVDPLELNWSLVFLLQIGRGGRRGADFGGSVTGFLG